MSPASFDTLKKFTGEVLRFVAGFFRARVCEASDAPTALLLLTSLATLSVNLHLHFGLLPVCPGVLEPPESGDPMVRWGFSMAALKPSLCPKTLSLPASRDFHACSK